MTAVTVVLDDYAIAASAGIERDLAASGALVMRSFKGLPNPNLLRRYRGAAVVGGPDRFGLVSRLETATATLSAPVIAILPPGVAPGAELRGPGVVDLIPAGARGVAERILLMARVPIVSGRTGRLAPAAPAPGAPRSPATAPPRPAPLRGAPATAAGDAPDLVAITSSTGGVWVLAALLRELPPEGCAVAVAQHLEADFVPFFAEWLQGVSGWRTVVVGAEPVTPAAGVAYLPAGGLDLVIDAATVRALPAASRYVPSGDRLFRSAAQALGARAIGVVLSGMGSDGAEGLGELARRGGRALCQDPGSAVVPSMPESALRKAPGAILAPPGALAGALARLRPDAPAPGLAPER